jgi:hypothetical protein
MNLTRSRISRCCLAGKRVAGSVVQSICERLGCCGMLRLSKVGLPVDVTAGVFRCKSSFIALNTA